MMRPDDVLFGELSLALSEPPVERDHVLYVWVAAAVALSVFAIWMLV
jgi:hypothetical protein